jgi:N6-adenosine-specific RNA methylase IME4
MVQFFLQQETQALESQAQADLERMLDDNVLALDLREAAYRVALEQHLEDVADYLREWGYDAD